MALLLLTAAAVPGRTVAATVDHGLRAGSAEEASAVAAICATRGIPHATLRTGAISGASLQARARNARYAVLADWARAAGADAVFTAHHADDQAETFLMRAARGSGLSGLSAIRPCSDIAGLLVLRPLLGWRRAELRAIVDAAGVPVIDDPTNDDPRHDRTHVRRLLAATPWLDPAALARSAAALAEAEADAATIADWLWRTRWHDASLDAADLPRGPQRRLVRRAIAAVRVEAAITTPAFDQASNVEPLLDALLAERAATHGGVRATVARGRWHFAPAPPRRS